ncbi:hypothetical protein SELMODRAFT_423738 [Selaginella moellendorffii]|uniref:Pentatricopeptide repeat-containing protein n=1 Tax=Selaginella moellendorffii TaxID=88036 RepID=D8SMQ2_SELML|nr:hypothetical protein SELMODRAFT_423738 [Selaginella moellendorffii]
MKMEGISPDEVTLLTLLHACNHGGLVGEALDHLAGMVADWGVRAGEDHWNAVVDVLGRAGHLVAAEELLKGGGGGGGGEAWTALLAACRIHGDERRGKRVVASLIRKEEEMEAMVTKSTNKKKTAPYVLLSNLYRDG